MVEIGEIKITLGKNTRLESKWILGGLERKTKTMFAVSLGTVSRDDVDVVASVVRKYIRPGSIIITRSGLNNLR